jgi:hypothetical protein
MNTLYMGRFLHGQIVGCVTMMSIAMHSFFCHPMGTIQKGEQSVQDVSNCRIYDEIGIEATKYGRQYY